MVEGSTIDGTGNALANIILRNSANNVLTGGNGDDTLNGSYGDDTLQGGEGNDTLDGYFGFDTIDGGSGDDVITSGWGGDHLTGGAGADIFRYSDTSDSSVSRGIDIIMDFESGIDRLDLSGIDAAFGIGGNEAFRYNGTTPAPRSAWFDVIQFEGKTFYIWYGDDNGDSLPDFQVSVETDSTGPADVIFLSEGAGCLCTGPPVGAVHLLRRCKSTGKLIENEFTRLRCDSNKAQ